jgi:hypothetical protein
MPRVAKPIVLGDEVKDTVTGFSGVAVARTKWMFGCDRITIQPKAKKDKDGKQELQNMEVFDEPQVKVTKRTGKPKPEDDDLGGPIPTPSQKPAADLR